MVRLSARRNPNVSDWESIALPKLPPGHFWRKKDADADRLARPGRYGFAEGAYFGRPTPIRTEPGRLVPWASDHRGGAPWAEFVGVCCAIGEARRKAPKPKHPNQFTKG